MEENTIYTGKVIWFDAKKGYGFIRRDDGQKDIFVHYSDISMNGYKALINEEKVSFIEDFSFNGKVKAINVKLLDK